MHIADIFSKLLQVSPLLPIHGYNSERICN
jgi:hypothetical protein